MIRFLTILLLLWLTPAAGILAQDEKPEDAKSPAGPDLEAEGPAQLLERGRAAFAENNFAAVRIHRPFVAICKVGLKKFEEALKWIDESLPDPKLDRALSDELRFWRAICLMTAGELVPAQRAFGEYWADETHNTFKRYEALLLFATLYIQQDFPAEAADFLEEQLPKFRELAPEAASRAVVLELYARLQAEQNDKALAVIRREHGNLENMTQVISFQTLALQLGSAFLEKEQYYEAITCLQRIWLSERLLEYQQAKIEQINERISLLEKRPNTQGTVFQLRAILKRVERELTNFQEIGNFDSALRLRLAMAYQGLGRYREAALIMGGMLDSMPPDPVVESATLAQIQCWMETQRWPMAVKAAERYESVFGSEGKSLPTVLFLKAEALREDQLSAPAQLAYGELVERFPDDPFAPKALFMQGFLYLQQDDNDGALYQFDQVKRKYPESEMVEDADYWTGMAHSFSGLYAEARKHLQGYLKRHKSPKYRKEATFRIAVCTFSLAEYADSIALLESFNEAYPGDPLTDEANLLIGDALLGEGDIEKGFAAYERVRPESVRFFEDAWFKKGDAYKLLEEIGTMRDHFVTFVETYPASGRLPEAVYWIGWTHTQEDEIEKARSIYWETIDKYGDDPDMTTMADLFAGLPKVYLPGSETGRDDLLTKLQILKVRAAAAGRTTLALRAGWAKSIVQDGKGAMTSRTELLDVAKWVDPKIHRPMITVAVAEALLESGNDLSAKELFTNIRKWNPRAVERGRIYKALGDIAAEEGETDRAIEFYTRFERESAASVHLGEVKLKMAELYGASGKSREAAETLESTLETPGVTAAIKAEALWRLGETFAGKKDHKKAIVYFERVYVAYGKFSELNAKAYWARGQSLEKLKLDREALETYEELAAREDLKRYDEFQKAETRIVSLRRNFPVEKEAAL
jgi:tetratricopeptide (TPR) repeat protein